MSVHTAAGVEFAATVPVVVIGGGACGMVAALMAHDAGADVVVLERDRVPAGSTALSSGMIPACGTQLQRRLGIDDSVAVMAADIRRKAHDEADAVLVETVCGESGPAVDWLIEAHAVDLQLVEGFLYPGHSKLRMHAPPSRTGAVLVASLRAAVERAGIAILGDALVADLFAGVDNAIAGVRVERPDGSEERIGCRALVLACNGFGGNREMIGRHIPEMAGAWYFGHAGNRGDAMAWGQALGATVRHMGAYQGHGSVATPHGILITWALMMEGGIQVNSEGRRFSNEHRGYSEQAVAVLEQPGGVAWDVYDERLHRLGQDFDDYRQAMTAGAVHSAASAAELAATIGVAADGLAATLAECRAMAVGEKADPLGRGFTAKPPLAPPFYAVKVTGALFHTQGGLAVDGRARVLRADGTPLPNLFAGGGAAVGVSGSGAAGYLSGNGLLTAVALGRIAGRESARLVLAGG